MHQPGGCSARTASIEDRVDDEITKSSKFAKTQITKMFDADAAEVTMYKGLAFRSMHSHGRALNGLLPRAVDDVEAYYVREGEFVAGPLLGWNFGDGHFHGAQLLAAVQERMNLRRGRHPRDHDRVPADLHVPRSRSSATGCTT